MNKEMKIKEMQDVSLKGFNRVRTGFDQFDQQIGGIRRGSLYVLASKTSVGKSAKMLQMAKQIAQQHQGECLIWSQEMDRNSLLNRMISNHTGIGYSKIRGKELNESDFERIYEAFDEIKKMPFHLSNTGRTNIDEIIEESRAIKERYGKLAVIFIDYLEMLDIPLRKGTSKDREMKKVVKKAKNLAMQLDCVVGLLVQIPQHCYPAPYTPWICDLNQYISNEADIVEILWENPGDQDAGMEYPNAKVIQSLVIERVREVSKLRYAFKGNIMKFHELPPKVRKDMLEPASETIRNMEESFYKK